MVALPRTGIGVDVHALSDDPDRVCTVSYTHLTLPTNREV